MIRTHLVALSIALSAVPIGTMRAQTPAPKQLVSSATLCKPQASLDVSKITSQLVVVGEVHGTNEIPEFVSGLLCSLLLQGKSVILGIEHTSADQAALNRFMVSEGTSADRDALLTGERWQSPFQDGRASQAMFAMLESARRLRSAGQRVGALAFDISGDLVVPMSEADRAQLSTQDNSLFSRSRDRTMADNLERAAILNRNYVVLALVGNLHASTIKGTSRDPEYRPMAQILEERSQPFIVGLRTEGGTSWYAGSDGYKNHALRTRALYSTETRVDAVVQLGIVSGSPSARAFDRP